MNIDEKIKEVQNHLHNLYEDADKTYTRPEDADMVIEVTAKQLKEYENVLTELKKYKDMEAVGRLVKLNCKAGDTIWYVEEDDDDYPIKLKIDTLEISKDNNDNEYIWYYAYDDDSAKYGFIDSDFGETVFFTKEEADMKLKEITENKIAKTSKPKDDNEYSQSKNIQIDNVDEIER